MTSTAYDLVIHAGTVVAGSEIRQADVGIQGERIAALGADLQGRECIDARGCLVLPGAIDPHVHLSMPLAGTVSSDDWFSGTVAAACGGTTTVIDFVEPRSGQTLLQALEERWAEAEGQAVVDVGLHMTLARTDPATLAEVPQVVEAGVTSFKGYTTYEGLRLEDAELSAALKAVADSGGLMMIHCEDDQTVHRATEALLAAGRRAPGEHGRSRPAHAEVLAVERAVDLAGEADTPVYIVHISTAGAAERVAAARANGRRVYGETCPQYLLLSEASYDLPGLEPAKFVCAPPLRSRSDQAALWQGLASGSLQSVGTDHCPFNYVGQKDRGADDFSRIPGGLPGIETRLALLHSYGVRPGRLTLRQWVELCCQAPARLFGLYPRKGSLEPGADADVVVFDPQRQVTLHHGGLHERVDYTPYEGLPLTGYPVLTVSRGRVVMQDGEFTGRAGQGRFLHAAPPDFGAKTDAG